MVDDMAWAHDTVRSCDWVVGCYYLVRREVIEQIGLFDPRYFLYFEEVDHCFAAKKAGWDPIKISAQDVVNATPFNKIPLVGGVLAAETDAMFLNRKRY